MKTKTFSWTHFMVLEGFCLAGILLLHFHGSLYTMTAQEKIWLALLCSVSVFTGVAIIWPVITFKIDCCGIWVCRFKKQMYVLPWSEWKTMGIFPLSAKGGYYVYISPRSVEQMRKIKTAYYSPRKYRYEAIARKFSTNPIMWNHSFSMREAGERDILLLHAGSYDECRNVCSQVLAYRSVAEQQHGLAPLDMYHFPKLMY